VTASAVRHSGLRQRLKRDRARARARARRRLRRRDDDDDCVRDDPICKHTNNRFAPSAVFFAAHTNIKNMRFLLASRPCTIHIGVSPRKLPVVLFRLIIVIFYELRITIHNHIYIVLYKIIRLSNIITILQLTIHRL